ncbi:hypothetical protein [Pelagerythrobacter rhizovicinus]|uniref:Uncharacterized protein n=1 Tax=Pelagerythrobacter rhizovicinus TaxID=2268576 RepID=A0A4Q2KLA0_9SPHN|nr:hypothetical protein [Pelagerythrobacter rhizovicinus]RXZ64093.1 hypothetical protein ETX26_09165 [Pelagerythrobacter rhizovicinus]
MRTLAYLAVPLACSIGMSAQEAYAASIPAVAFVQAASGPGVEPNGQTADGEQVECRRIKVTGSRIKRKRICMTVAQWEEQGRQGRNQATEMQDSGTIDPAGDPTG